MNHGIVVGEAGVALVVAGLAGCSSTRSHPGASTAGSAQSAAGPQVIIDGQKQNVTGQVSCSANGDNSNIGIGAATNGVGAVLSNANPPIVHAVGLGDINDSTLAYSDAAPNQNGNTAAALNSKYYPIKAARRVST